MKLLIIGTLGGGFRFCGPFEGDAAFDYAEHAAPGEAWEVVDLEVAGAGLRMEKMAALADRVFALLADLEELGFDSDDEVSGADTVAVIASQYESLKAAYRDATDP